MDTKEQIYPTVFKVTVDQEWRPDIAVQTFHFSTWQEVLSILARMDTEADSQYCVSHVNIEIITMSHPSDY